MKKAIALVVSLILVVAFGTVVMAQQEKAPAEKKAPAKARQVTGEVIAIDAKANTVTVRGRKGDVVISVDDKTRIALDKEKKTIADIKAGDRIRVRFTEVDKKNVARSIVIVAQKKPEEKPAAKPAEKPAAPVKKPAPGY
ncbi:MAG TPA: hypothetical protein DEP99_00160 [Nitrospiraceae bacterium]|nr:hypothetical protein [Nitrospiraceae bacterium]